MYSPIEAPSERYRISTGNDEGPMSQSSKIIMVQLGEFDTQAAKSKYPVFPPLESYRELGALKEHFQNVLPIDILESFIVQDTSTDSHRDFLSGFYTRQPGELSQDAIVINFTPLGIVIQRISMSQKAKNCDCTAWSFRIGANTVTPESYELSHWSIQQTEEAIPADIFTLLHEKNTQPRDLEIHINSRQQDLFENQHFDWARLANTYGFPPPVVIRQSLDSSPILKPFTLENIKQYIFGSYAQPLPPIKY